MRFVSHESRWSGDPDAGSFAAWFADCLDGDRLEEVVCGLDALDPRLASFATGAFVAAERARPLSAGQVDSNTLPLTRLTHVLARDPNEALLRVLELVANGLRNAECYARALDLSEAMGRACERRGDLLWLGRSLMWQGRLHTDLRHLDRDMPCFWRARAIFQHLHRTADGETLRRKAALGLSSIEHQWATKCGVGGDQAARLLYNYRALAMREHLGSEVLRAATLHNLANGYRALDRPGAALVNYLRTVTVEAQVVADGGSLDTDLPLEQSRALTLENLSDLCMELGEPAIALRFIEKAMTIAPDRVGLAWSHASALLQLERYADGEAVLERMVSDPRLAGGTRERVLKLLVALCDRLERLDDGKRHRAGLLDVLVETRRCVKVSDAALAEMARERLAQTPKSDHAARAVLLSVLGETETALAALNLGMAAASNAETRAQLVAMRRQLSEAGEDDGEPAAGASHADTPDVGVDRAVHVPAGDARMPGSGRRRVPAFLIDRLPVTNAMYGRFLEETGETRRPDRWTHPLWSHPEQPVTCVSLADCEAFCAWRSGVTGRRWRVPTVEQWYRAALGSDDRRHPWGDEPVDHTRAAYGLIEDPDVPPMPVGLLPGGASPFGVVDMAGNVWEWTRSAIPVGGSCGAEAGALELGGSAGAPLEAIPADTGSDGQLGFRCVVEEDA